MRRRKPFENDAQGLALFIFLLILAVICFGMAVVSLFAEFVGVNPILGKSVLFLLFSGMGLVPASFAKTMWEGEFL